MKVTHICLAGIVTDGFSYQDNLLPKYHKKLGYEVSLITSKYIWNRNGDVVKTNKTNYFNVDGVEIIRLDIKKDKPFSYKFKRYKNLYRTLSELNSDVFFIHGCQFLDIKMIVKYLRFNNRVKVFVDNHADFSNSATSWLSKNILHKIIWKRCAQLIEPYTERFYGVLPARVDFLKSIYKLPEEKVELLLMGADDELVENADEKQREINRKKYNIKDDDFLIVTGGKIDLAKQQTLLLMKAIKEINKENVKLIIFGSIVEELKDEVLKLVDGDKIQYIGWIDSEYSYKIFNIADLAVFPGRHSVYWEQVVGQGIPALFKYWEGTTHVDVGGNCCFLYSDTTDEIKEKLLSLIGNHKKYNNMKKIAKSIGKEKFSYERISKRSINN